MVPEGYFDRLPGIIQSRVSENSQAKVRLPVSQFALRYALPVVVVAILGVMWFSKTSKPMDAESILASVQTEDLVAYLDEADVSTEEMLESVGFSEEDLEEIEVEVYELTIGEHDLLNVVDEINSNNL